MIQVRLGHGTARLSLELYAHVPEVADPDVATHLEDRWTKTKTTGTGTNQSVRARSGHETPSEHYRRGPQTTN